MNQVVELVARLFGTQGVAQVVQSRRATLEYLIGRLHEVAVAVIKYGEPLNGPEREILLGLISTKVQQIVIPGSQVSIDSLVSELAVDAKHVANLVMTVAGVEQESNKAPEPPQPEVVPPAEPVTGTTPEPQVTEPVSKSKAETVRAISIGELKIDTRARSAYLREPLATIGDIIDYSKARPLPEIKGIGDDFAEDTLKAIKVVAEEHGVTFEDL